MIGSVINPHEYVNFFNSIKDQIQQARINASKVVNRELVLLYQRIGQQIVESQEKYGWGRSVVENLSKDLMQQFPGNSSFSPRNLWSMRQIHIEYDNYTILKQLVSEIPWGHNISIMQKVTDMKAREYVIRILSKID